MINEKYFKIVIVREREREREREETVFGCFCGFFFTKIKVYQEYFRYSHSN